MTQRGRKVTPPRTIERGGRLAEEVRSRRVARSLSREALARTAGISTETIGSNTINLTGGILFPALIVGLAGSSGLVDFNFGWLLGMTCVALLLLSRTAGIGRRARAGSP